jgi:hypothetical protein
MEDERFSEACPKFEESLRLDHGMGTQFNLAHCWEKLGRTASAWALFLDVAAAARAANQQQREAAARKRASELEPQLTRLRVSVPDPASGTVVTRDEQAVGEAAWGTAVPVDPGDHNIVVTAPGKVPWSHTVQVPASAKTFSVEVPSLSEAPEEHIPSMDHEVDGTAAPASPRDGAGPGSQRVAAIVVGGVGLVGVAAGTVFALQSRNANDKALGLCRSSSVDSQGYAVTGCLNDTELREWQGVRDDAKQKQLLSYVSFGVGGAALVAAIVLYATADGSSDSALNSSPFNIAPLVGDGQWGASFTGQF